MVWHVLQCFAKSPVANLWLILLRVFKNWEAQLSSFLLLSTVWKTSRSVVLSSLKTWDEVRVFKPDMIHDKTKQDKTGMT